MEYIQDYNARKDLIEKYGNSALMLYALQLRYNIADIVSVASDALTDGSDDKKCDLIYVDSNIGVAVIAQGYMRQNSTEDDLAKENKASDLNTAAAWVFSREADDVPERIQEQVKMLQDGIEDGSISTVYFWYVHNLNERNNPKVREEMITLQSSARKIFKGTYPNNDVEIFAFEVGNETLEKWYNASNKRITIIDKCDVETLGKGFEFVGKEWKAYITAVSAAWLKHVYKIYNDELFSGNLRNYLGSGKKKNKINLGIMESIDDEPENFWAYNNGVTALVKAYDIEKNNGGDSLTIHGITVINGAQTTGAISNVQDVKDAWVPIRFIVCSNPEVIDKIISNNNKQNEIFSADLRSNDLIQNRLRQEFLPYPKLYYSGGRRGAKHPSRSKEILDPYVVSQSLLAFHGDCVTAYNSKKDLWSNDKLYSSIFSDSLTAKHIIFTYSLARAIDNYKITLQQKGQERTDIEEQEHRFFSKRGSKMILLYTISRCMEGICGKKIHDNWKLSFKNNSSFDTLIKLWTNVIDAVLPMSLSSLEFPLKDGLKSKDDSFNAANAVVGLFAAIQKTAQVQLRRFINSVEM